MEELYNCPLIKVFSSYLCMGGTLRHKEFPYGVLWHLYPITWMIHGVYWEIFQLSFTSREKNRGNEVTESEMTDFGDCLSNCGLQEFSYIGAFFTWTNTTIWSMIDRALHNTLWYDTFDYTYVIYQPQGISDHFPISFEFPTCPRPKKSFQFCDM